MGEAGSKRQHIAVSGDVGNLARPAAAGACQLLCDARMASQGAASQSGPLTPQLHLLTLCSCMEALPGCLLAMQPTSQPTPSPRTCVQPRSCAGPGTAQRCRSPLCLSSAACLLTACSASCARNQTAALRPGHTPSQRHLYKGQWAGNAVQNSSNGSGRQCECQGHLDPAPAARAGATQGVWTSILGWCRALTPLHGLNRL